MVSMQTEIETSFARGPEISEDEFYRRVDEDSPWQYLGGRPVMAAAASNRHENLFSFLLTLLRGFLDERGGGAVRGSRYPMRLDPSWSPEPDLLIVGERKRSKMTQQRLEGPADLVIEIASESDPGFDRREKLPRYLEAEIPEIWLIDPFENTVLVQVLAAEGYKTRQVASGRLESAVVRGFWIDVDWLWQDEPPSTFRCLQRILG
jgi:Uma2 family endonuclease